MVSHLGPPGSATCQEPDNEHAGQECLLVLELGELSHACLSACCEQASTCNNLTSFEVIVKTGGSRIRIGVGDNLYCDVMKGPPKF